MAHHATTDSTLFIAIRARARSMTRRAARPSRACLDKHRRKHYGACDGDRPPGLNA